MDFFFKSYETFIKSYHNLFGLGNSQDDLEGEEDIDNEQDTKKESDKWGWIKCIDQVAQTTNRSWEEIYNLNIVEFLNTMSYIKDNRKEFKKKYGV